MEFFGQIFDYTGIATCVCTLGMYYQEYVIVTVSLIIVDYVIVMCFVLAIFKFHFHLPARFNIFCFFESEVHHTKYYTKYNVLFAPHINIRPIYYKNEMFLFHRILNNGFQGI